MQRIFIALLMLPFLIGCSEKKPAPDQLSLDYTETTDEELGEKLKELPGLKKLELTSCRKITDAGLVHLKGLTNLEELSLHDTKTTPAGIKSLQEALPDCKISR